MSLKPIRLVPSPREDRLSLNLVLGCGTQIRVLSRCLGRLERGQREGLDG